MRVLCIPIWTLLLLVWPGSAALSQDRDTKVRNDRAAFVDSEFWIYDDLNRARELARASGKPLLVVFRCVPCEACALFDEQVARRDEKIRNLMDQFVLVRIVKANGLDLAKFQFDYDLSFSAFFMNAAGDIYGRFGTRSSRDHAEQDISLEGFQRAMEGALALHRNLAIYKPSLAGKQGPAPRYPTPETYPSLTRFQKELDYEGKVASSCIHCHQVREAERLIWRTASQPVPEEVLFPWPMPNVLGLKLDPKERATVVSVTPASAAAKAGFEPGDEIITLAGQPLLSIADAQWVLHQAGSSGELPAEVKRNGQKVLLTLPLEAGWRRRSDISWRATTWDLRRMVSGGMVLQELSQEERTALGFQGDALALRVEYLGQYGEHAAAKQAGFQKGDVIVKVGDRKTAMNESDFLDYLLSTTRPGDRITLEVLREGRPRSLVLPMQ